MSIGAAGLMDTYAGDTQLELHQQPGSLSTADNYQILWGGRGPQLAPRNIREASARRHAPRVPGPARGQEAVLTKAIREPASVVRRGKSVI